MISAFVIYLFCLIAIFGIAALALNLTLGWGGLINLGFMGLVSIGAYTSAILSAKYHVPIVLGVLLGMIFSGFASAVLGLLIRRVHGDALAVILLGFHFAVYAIAMNWTSLTRGPRGVPGIPRPEWFYEDRFYFLLVVVLFFLTILILRRIANSSFGRVLGSLRDDELHARVLGKRAFRVKLVAYAISGVFAGLSGALLAHFLRYIDPGSFFIDQLVLVLSMIFIGGLASVRGTVAGAILVTLLPQAVNIFVNLPSATVGALRGIIFSLLLLLVVMFRPKGLFGKVELPNAYADRD